VNVETNKVTRRRRKSQPRRVPAVIEQREQKPFLFGWGGNLNHREREALKERFALFVGIALAIVLAAIIGWGWYQDAVVKPAAIQAANNTEIAKVGKYTIREGFFKRFVHFRKTQLNSTITQLQQQESPLQADPKKNQVQLAQIQAQVSSAQQQLSTVATDSETQLINQYVMLQRSNLVGVKDTPKLQRTAWTQIQAQAGGPIHLQTFINQTGLSTPEFRQVVTADYLQTKVANKLSAKVSHHQLKVRASHILIPAKKKSLAVKVYHMALSGANFAALAHKYSTDTASAKKGGDLGYFAHGAMVPVFDKAAFSMKPGQIRLIKSQFGWHIIKITGRENHKLTATEYQQAQQAAYQTWLNRQTQILHVQRLLDVTTLPGMKPTTPPTNPLGSLGQTSNQVPAQVPQGNTVKKVSGKKASSTTKKK
jgi:parvulin-like peptidyl-prolyl isomerase